MNLLGNVVCNWHQKYGAASHKPWTSVWGLGAVGFLMEEPLRRLYPPSDGVSYLSAIAAGLS